MKKMVCLGCVLLLVLCTSSRVLAATTVPDIAKSQGQVLGTDKLQASIPQEARQLFGKITVTDGLDISTLSQKLMTAVSEQLGDIVQGALKSALTILLIAVLCAVGSAAFDGAATYVGLAGVMAIAVVSVTNVSTFVGLGGKTLEDMSTFSKMLLPTLTAAATASGALTSAAAKYAATVLFLDVLMTVSKNVVLPLIYGYTAASIAQAAFGGESLAGAAQLLRWLAKTVLTVFMLVFVAYLSLTSVVSGATDAVTAKALKTTISTVLPVVGGIIADASDTVLAGASILRNGVGILGLVTILGTCLLPFLRLGSHYLLFKAVAGLSGAIAESRITTLVNAVSGAFGMLLGLVGATALMLFISVISVIKVAGGA